MENIFDQVTCQAHNKNHITIGTNFQITCSKCITEGLTGHEKLSMTKQPEVLKKFCHKHLSEDAQFFCDDCFEFICKNCLLLVHRNHNSSTPELVVNPLLEN